jgi:hypothetical protein
VVPGHSKGDVTGRGKQAFTVGRESGVEAKGTAASTSGLIVLDLGYCYVTHHLFNVILERRLTHRAGTSREIVIYSLRS